MSRRSARVVAKEQANCTLLQVEGEIDSTFDPKAFAGRGGLVVIDLGGVRRITSHGILHWMSALNGLEASYYCFIKCRACAMDQFNLVENFGRRGELVSFFAPFCCTHCGHETEQLIDLRYCGDMLDLAPPPIKCSECDGTAVFDELPELYLKHVRAAAPPRLPPAVNALLGGGEVAPSRGHTRFELRKEVDESVTALWMSGILDRGAYLKRTADSVDGIAVLEIGDLEGVTDVGLRELEKLLKKLGDETVFARVPAAMVDPLAKLFADSRKLKCQIVSFLVPFICTGCQASFGGELDGQELPSLAAANAEPRLCPRCLHPLLPQWAPELVARARALPVAAAHPSVRNYLKGRPPTRRFRQDRLVEPGKAEQLLLGKYQILHPLGQGGMGEVFLARQVGPHRFDKLVVLKRIRRDRLGDPQSRDLFLGEARIAGRLSHRNIVEIFDLERLDDEFLISMEYVNGIDLARALHLSREFKLFWPIEICCRVLAELCNALHAAHTFQDEEGRQAPIIHRDVSPSNILLSTEGAVKLADFGIARVLNDPSNDDPMRGKAGYAAPEQWAGSTGVLDERTDVYAVGVILYECVTLRPISAGSTLSSGRSTASGRPISVTGPTTQSGTGWRTTSPPQICVARSGAPPLLQDVFERAIQTDPAHRYARVSDLGRDLERIGRLASETTIDDLARWIRRIVALRLENDGVAPPLTIHTGSTMTGRLTLHEPGVAGSK